MKYLLTTMILIISGCSTNKIYNNILVDISNVLITNYSNNYLLRDLSAKQFDVGMFNKLNTAVRNNFYQIDS